MAPKPIYDGQLSFEGGQDASLPPSRLSENRIASGINITTSQGVIGPRFAYDRKQLKFPSGGYAYRFNKIIDFSNIFFSGKFQAQCPYQIEEKYYQLVVISGVIFLINQDTFDVIVLTQNADTQLNETSTRINRSPAGRFLVLHDFPSRPIIVEGQVARRSNPDEGELPTSNMGIYNNSRYVFANAGNEFTAGDPVGNALTPDAPVSVFEIIENGPYVGEVYQAPSEYNRKITALARLQATDDSTGIGSVLVATKREIFAYNTRVPRQDWGKTEAGQFGSMLLYNAGIVGPRAFVNVNSDLFFVSADGELRSLSTGRDDQQKWARVPMSVEVKNWLGYLAPELVEYSVLCYFKNRIFWTAQPYRIPAKRLDGNKILDVAHRGLLVLEMDNISRTGAQSSPAWAGMWTGVRPMDMNVNNERMFIMSKDYYNRNQLYEVRTDLQYDQAQEQKRPIRSIVYTREHTFKDLFSLKDLQNIELGMSEITGDFNIQVEWKPSHSSKFLPWANFSHSVPYERTEFCGEELGQRTSLSFRELRFGLPDLDRTANPITEELYDKVKRVQCKFTISADSWKLNEYRITATEFMETNNEFLHNLKTEPIEADDAASDWQYEEFGI